MLEFPVYSDDVIAVALFARDSASAEDNGFQLAIRWLPPKPSRQKDGTLVSTTNAVGGPTDWFRLPNTFGLAIGRKLVEQRVAGLPGFEDDGANRMIAWLVDSEELEDVMCY